MAWLRHQPGPSRCIDAALRCVLVHEHGLVQAVVSSRPGKRRRLVDASDEVIGPQTQAVLRHAVGELRVVVPDECSGGVAEQPAHRARSCACHVALECRGVGPKVSGFGFRVSDFGFRVSGFGFRICVWGSGCRVQGVGLRV